MSSNRKKYCCNPFLKRKHTSWRNSSKMRNVSKNIINKLVSCGVINLPKIGDRICDTCRLDIPSQQRQYIASTIREEQVEEVTGVEPNVPIVEPVEEGLVHKNNKIKEVLQLLGLGNIRMHDIRSKKKRVDYFKQAVHALQCLLDVENEKLYYEDSDVPVVQDLLKCYSDGSKAQKFKILAILAGSWNRQKMMAKTGCSKYITIFN